MVITLKTFIKPRRSENPLNPGYVTKTIKPRGMEMTWRQRIIGAFVHPNRTRTVDKRSDKAACTSLREATR
jgi:hypothetical protein